jgi:hypothetical protein
MMPPVIAAPPLPSVETMNTLAALLEVIAHPKRAHDALDKLKHYAEEFAKSEARLHTMRSELEADLKEAQKQKEDTRRGIAADIKENERRAMALTGLEKTNADWATKLQQKQDTLNRVEHELSVRETKVQAREQALTQRAQEVEQRTKLAEQRLAETEKREAKLRAALA